MPHPSLFDPQTPGNQTDPLALVAPLIVVSGDQPERYVVVDGCKRLGLARAEGRRTVACGVIDGGELDATGIGLLRLTLNCGRPLHLREKIRFVGWLAGCLDTRSVDEYCARLGINGRERKDLVHLAAAPGDIADLVADGRLHLANVADFLWMSEDDRQGFCEAFRNLALSVQTERELLEWLHEIAVQQGCAMREVLAAPSIQELLDNAHLTAPQRIEKIHAAIHRMRFPLFARAQETFRGRAAACNPQPSAVRFIADPCFEKDRLTVQVTVASGTSAADIFSRLAQIPASQWDGLINPWPA